MQTNSPHPITQPALGFLDCRASLSFSPIASTPAGTNLPPVSFLLIADRLAQLYEVSLPNHPEWLDEDIMAWATVAEVAAATEQFLRRISQLFPVYDEIWEEDLEVIEWRLYEIPVMPMGYDLWHEDWQDLKEPAPYLLHMCHSRQSETSVYGRHNDFEDLYPELSVPPQLEPRHLIASLRQMVTEQRLLDPLAALPDLIEMLDYNTGNWWLDVGEMSLMEGGGYPLWKAEELVWLTAEWQEAEPIWLRVQRLLDWQNESPEAVAAKLTAVRQALLDAFERTTETSDSEVTT